MIEGRCLCGTVRFAVDAVRDLSHCHCSMCRKHHGAAFATMARVREEAFRWTAGEDAVRRYESSPGFHRSFCTACGSSLPGRSPAGGWFVPAGLFADDPGKRPNAHIFAASAPAWDRISDDLIRFDGWPPNKGLPEIARARPEGVEGLAGSCLCGGIVWEVLEPFGRVHNCHCSRCQRARAAAHATNGFTSADGLRFLRGEELAVDWKLPEARFFAVSFCRVCGSGVPRRSEERGLAVTPMAALDDDPGRDVDRHIYTGSMAPWHRITDDLPQFDEAAPGPVLPPRPLQPK